MNSLEYQRKINVWADLGCSIDIDLDHEINTSFSVSIGKSCELE